MTVEPGPATSGDIRIRDRGSMVAALRARRRELGLPQLALDQIAGLTDGHTAKIETPNQTASWARPLTMETMSILSDALGIEFKAVPRAARTKGNNASSDSRLSDAYTEFMSERGRRLARARWAKASAKQRKRAVTRMNRARLKKRRQRP